MRALILLISLLPFIAGCNSKKDAEASSTVSTASTAVKFDKAKWQTKDGEAYPYRDDMLQNLIDSVNLKNIPYDSLISILGQPDRVNEGHLYYNVYRKEAGGVTMGTRSFVIKLKADSTVEWRKIHGG